MYQDLFKPSYLIEVCSSVGLKPSKLFGQNYLINKGIIQKILDGANLTKKDIVIEVGPGFGVLTLGMAPLVKKILAFEIEQKLTDYWSEVLDKSSEYKVNSAKGGREGTLGYKNVEIIWGNVLNSFYKHEQELEKTGDYKVVANLPYQITGKVIPLFLQAKNPPTSMTVMVQKEVAQRICASKGDMSVLAIAVQYFGKPSILTYVSAGSFFPPPKVDSAVIHISDIKSKPNAEAFFRIVKSGFASKRKQLWKNLSSVGYDGNNIKEILVNIGATSTARAQELSVSQWEKLVQELAK